MAKNILLTLLAIGLLAGLGSLAGFAVFTDQETAASNTFTSGTVDLTLGTTTALVTFSNMKPGDSTGSQSELVTNSGSLDLSYTLSTSMVTDTGGPPPLGDELNLTIWQDVLQNGCTAPSTGDDSAALYGPADLNNGALGARVLTSGTNETLCFLVELPSLATGPEGASANATFVFDATQN